MLCGVARYSAEAVGGDEHYESVLGGWGGFPSEIPYFLPWEPACVEDLPSSLCDIRALVSCQYVVFVGLDDTL